MSTIVRCNYCDFEITSPDVLEAIALSDNHLATHPESTLGGEGK